MLRRHAILSFDLRVTNTNGFIYTNHTLKEIKNKETI